MMKNMRPFSLVLVLSFALAACGTGPDEPSRFAPEDAKLVLRAADTSVLPGWNEDDVAQVLPALQKSCARILKAAPDKAFGADVRFGTMADWQMPCNALAQTPPADVRAFMNQWFNVYAASAEGHETGLFTGYYEASLNGSRTRHGSYQTPLRVRPTDLVMVDLGQFRDSLKGQRIAGRVVDGNLKPFESRDQIEAQTPTLKDDDATVLAWVDNPVDAFFLQIQGSGRVQMDDGSVLQVGYAAQNGHPYTAIGRELIKRGAMAKEEVSMQSIRAWLEAHPDQADELMNVNASYVYFQLIEGEGPLGGENIALTAGRSLAIDRSKIPYGVPLWLDAGGPGSDTDKTVPSIRRLMMAQDTGGAIRGAVRGDVYFGFGDAAEHNAGLMKSDGRYWFFIPKSVKFDPQ
ncbi:murein transglycosylase A [Micavibrio aeruginosavorus]|uniref:murein transglycosylase A n=1 Tax=Micavibrio aeruginosavorus TaxID=349221 RepID=UPI003F4A96B3